MAGSSTRSSACAKARAVTGLPSEKRASLRIVNVYVLPSLETTGSGLGQARREAIAGGGGLSGYATSVPQAGEELAFRGS